MNAPLDTRLPGDPESVCAAGRWLSEKLAAEVDRAVDAMYSARRLADGGWEGPASEGFRKLLTTDAQTAERFAEAVTDYGRHIDRLAVQLRSVQSDLAHARDIARESGLAVEGGLIHQPGNPPPVPAVPPEDALPSVVSAYDAAVSARRRHDELTAAFEIADAAVRAARSVWMIALESTRNVGAEITSKWFFFAANSVNGISGALAVVNAAALRKNAAFLAGEAQKYIDLARAGVPGTPTSVIYRDFDLGRAFAHRADDAAAAAVRSDGLARTSGIKLGGALAVAGVAYDVLATDKPVGQAVVSGAAGFGASLAAGAGIGAISGSVVPILGTTAGAIVGAAAGSAAGLFTSGSVDAVYANGIGDVGGAVSAGVDAVAEAGSAVGDVVEGIWDALF